MNITPSESEGFVKAFIPLVKDNREVEIVLCPSSPTIERVTRSLKDAQNIKTGGQNIYFEVNGAFTGETSASMLKDLGCSYVILGHSERREIFHETNDMVNKKVKKALQTGLSCIVCVGEKLSERQNGRTESVVKDHVTNSLANFSKDDMKNIVIAYEPVWAIGTGVNATPEQAEEVHVFIRGLLKDMFDEETAEATRIQYGGSVKPENIKELMAQKNIDGALVGGASLKPDSFAKIVNYQ
ncbi:MAG: triose-phosphate isomerase [Candidatus Aureabacteria bacterium]|nr:triose-phosphate isomerase [Candidatus Auribacterota bacterium]